MNRMKDRDAGARDAQTLCGLFQCPGCGLAPDHPLMTGERGGMEEVPPEDWEIPFWAAGGPAATAPARPEAVGMRVSKFDRRICRFLLDGTQTRGRGRPSWHRSRRPRWSSRTCPSSGASARRATCPPCRRTSPRCSGSRGALWRFRTSSARRHPSTVYHSLCPGARSSPPSFPGGLAKATARENHTARAAPPVPGARPSCLNCSIFRAHGAHFPVITRTTSW